MNVKVLRRARVERSLMKRVLRRQVKFLDHITRAEELDNDCLSGRFDGTRARGRQQKTHMDSIPGVP